MTHFEFTTICLKYYITPLLVWEHQECKELIKNNTLNVQTLTKLIENNF